MHEDSRFLSWVVELRTIVSNFWTFFVQLSTLEVVSITLENIFICSWGINPTDMFPPNVYTIARRAYDNIVTFHGFVLQSNYERLKLKRIELKHSCDKEHLARIRQEIRDKVASNVCASVNHALGDALSNNSDYDEGWLDRYDSDL